MAAPAPYLPPLPKEYRHNGKRVVAGQRALQASSDPNAGLDLDQWPRLLRAPDEEPKGIDPGGMADRRIVQLLRLGLRRNTGARSLPNRRPGTNSGLLRQFNGLR
jgi:hypothetical protein